MQSICAIHLHKQGDASVGHGVGQTQDTTAHDGVAQVKDRHAKRGVALVLRRGRKYGGNQKKIC